MTAKTKAQLAAVTNQVNVLAQSQAAKKKTITYLVIALVVVAAVIVFFVVFKKGRK